MAIAACRKHGKYVGICGQGPSDHPDLARWLLEQGIESMSLNPDTVVETWLFLAQPRATSKPPEAPAARSRRLILREVADLRLGGGALVVVERLDVDLLDVPRSRQRRLTL